MRAEASRRWLPMVVGALLLTLVAWPGAASAHTDLDFTVPADGDTVAEPVSEVSVAFTAAVELVGNGFEALDPQGNLLEPPAVTDDDQVFRLQFDPPLAGGAVGVRYEIRASDGHVLSGSFSFVVDAPVSSTAPATTAPAAPETTVSTVTTEPAPQTTDDATSPASTTTNASTTTASPTTSGTTTTIVTLDADSDGGSGLGVVLAILVAAAVGVGGFLLVRSRTTATP